MSQATGFLSNVKFVVVIALLAVLTSFVTGCAGYVDGGYGDYSGYDGYYDGGPDIYLFGDGYGRGRDAQYYSHRGAESRGFGHSGGGGFGGHGGGRHGGGGHGGGGHGGGGGRH